mmetsp:Transcript_25407/g.30118  ORF Transcript_25407/g.30118 Transcript_25407/m.30118 type:complete len:350 (+) Transcript_25407:21-1070(+)
MAVEESASSFRPNQDIVPLECYSVVRSISHISSSQGTFRASLEVWAWLWLSEEENNLRRKDPRNWDYHVVPHPNPYNGIDIKTAGIIGANGLNHHVRITKDGKCKALFGWQIDATFATTFDLCTFPMDSQELIIDIMFNTYTDPNEYKNYEFKLDWVKPRFGKFMLFHEPSWDLLRDSIKRQPHSDIRHYEIRVYISRNYSYYFLHMLPVLSLLAAMPLVVYCFGEDSLSARFGAILTIVFATVIQLFIVHGELPRLSYWTMLDKYVYMLFIFYVCNIIFCLLSQLLNYAYDSVFFALSLVIYVGVHIWFTVAQRSNRRAATTWLEQKLGDNSLTKRQQKEATFSETKF